MNPLKEKIKKSRYYPFFRKLYSIVFIESKNRLQKLKYILIGRFLGIDISLTASSINNDIYCQYQPAYTWYIKRIMKCFSISKSDKLLDYGSGKGAAMIFFARYPFCEIGGVEYDESLHKIALNNFNAKKLKNLTSYCGDATQFANIDQYTYFFFYNPFLGKVLELTIEQIRQSLIRNPRKITVLYANPQGRQLFISSGLFPYISFCFVPSLINFNKNNKRYGRQFVDIYCTENLSIDFAKYGIKTIENNIAG